MLFQRDQGVLGVLIVEDEETGNTNNLLRDVIDAPEKNMFVIRDHVEVDGLSIAKAAKFVPPFRFAEKFVFPKSQCEPDGSIFPLFPLFGNNVTIEQLRLNGVKLDTEIGDSDPPRPIFEVDRGQKYRFRIVGVMSSNVIRFSVDKHKLKVIAADGYLVEPYETDILIIHIAERFDFILEANQDYPAGTVFPIRIETVAVKCSDYFTPYRTGYAYLQYTVNGSPSTPELLDHYHGEHRCQVEECQALNCPFENYPPEANTTCHNITHALRLLNPTPDERHH